ncbi:hypothetical protein BRC96_00670 [Halobacteriales archaeon QS_6_64_34]|nr:MAG: hypothetical protein BRC96_00670 [Halobacteriales archaeon QS_6_64_34]
MTAVVGVAGAGCSTLLGGGEAETDVFTRWLPAPTAVTNTDHYRFDYYDLATLGAQREHLGGEPTVFERTWEPVGLAWDDATAVVTVGSVDVVTAEFDRDGAVSDLEAAGYDRAGEYKGYVRYRNGETGTVFALTDGTLLVASVDRFAADAVAPTERLETVVGAATGDVDRYAEANEDIRAVVEELGRATLVSARTLEESDAAGPRSGRFENLVAEGTRSVVDGERVAEKWVYVYERPRDVDTAALEAYVQASDNSSAEVDQPFVAVDDISYTTEGRKGIITGTRDAGEYYDDA